MHIVNLKEYYCSETDVVNPPTPFWNKVRTGGKEQFSRVNRGGGALLQRQSPTNSHGVTHGERWPSCTSPCSMEGGVWFPRSLITPCISTGMINNI